MDTKVSYRNLNIEQPQTQPKVASTGYVLGMWIQFDGAGHVEPLVGNTTIGTANGSAGAVEGLCSQFIPSTDTTNALLSYDGIDDTVDRWVMPVIASETITFTVGSGTFTAGETITGGTSGATAIISNTTAGVLVVHSVVGTFVVGETIASGGTNGVILTIAVSASPIAGSIYNAGPDSITLDSSVIGTQFQVTRVISATLVEVRVIKDNN